VLISGFDLADSAGVVNDAWLALDGGRVVGRGQGPPPGCPDDDLGGAIVVPGFVDLHCHGAGDASYASAEAEEVARAVQWHRSRGTTTTLASLVSAEPLALAEQVGVLAECARAGLVAGVHLEGPYLSPRHAGAHDPQVLRSPDLDELAYLSGLARGALRVVTLAPELPCGPEATAWLASRGVLVAAGHTGASYEEACLAVEAGVRIATHLGNAMAALHQRLPGCVAAFLEDPRVTCELIVDGVHLHPAYERLVLRSVGVPRVALVTDAVATKDGIEARNGAARVEGTDRLAGSTLCMHEAFSNAVRDLSLGLPQAVQVTSGVPGALLGLPNAGLLVPGAQADLVVMDRRLGLSAVMARGGWVPDVPAPTR
jgi:N-acetylglucosamine-6-phosphate deacetylase